MRSRRRPPDSELQNLVHRLLRINQTEADISVIISSMEGAYHSSVGRLLKRKGARVSALVDFPMERERAVKVFLPENAYVGEVVSCVADSEHFTIELNLIQQKSEGQET